jgi:hypothetical protein
MSVPRSATVIVLGKRTSSVRPRLCIVHNEGKWLCGRLVLQPVPVDKLSTILLLARNTLAIVVSR